MNIADIVNTENQNWIILNALTEANASLGVFRYNSGVKSIRKPQYEYRFASETIISDEKIIKMYEYHFKKTLYQFPVKYIPGIATNIGISR
jgi:hypothetical protein